MDKTKLGTKHPIFAVAMRHFGFAWNSDEAEILCGVLDAAHQAGWQACRDEFNIVLLENFPDWCGTLTDIEK